MYYLMINGQRTGPYEVGEVRQMLRQNAIGYETQFWKDGMMDWSTIGAERHIFDEPFAGQYAAPPPQQQRQQHPHRQAPPVQHVYHHASPVVVQPVVYAANKSRVAYILLGLFLGGLGVHNFYAGYSGKGVAQLLLTLFLFWTIVVPIAVWIWIIVELCTVDHDAYGNRMT